MKPVILVAFANNADHPILSLFSEQAGIEKKMAGLVDQGLCELVIIEQADIQSILQAFKAYRHRITIFHFAGHAKDFELYLENNDGRIEVAHAGGFAEFLSLQQGLELVFLNACSTEPQVESLLKANVGAVIATSTMIDEGVATFFAINFYGSMGKGSTIFRAYQEAVAAVKMKFGDRHKKLSAYYKDGEPNHYHLPLEIHIREGSEIIKSWNIPAAAGDPLFGLPPIEFKALPEKPFRYFHWYRTMDAPIFFGRSRQIRNLFDKITDPLASFVIHFYGKSGVGKSSLLAAGLLPRLQPVNEVIYLRKEPHQHIVQTLAMNLSAKPSYNSIRSGWLDLEIKTTRPLTIIIDQLEEVFTSPLEPEFANKLKWQLYGEKLVEESHQWDELDDLINLLHQFAQGQDQPKGKIIFAYRKEYLAEIENRFYTRKVQYEKVFLHDLDRQGVLEAITGISKTARTKEKYNIDIEEGLPDLIGHHLLQDQDALVAPVLQVLLSKMWDRTNSEKPRHFTKKLYVELQREGLLLEDFVNQKIDQLKKDHAASVESGLIYDILMYHTTSKLSGGKRSRLEISNNYHHLGGEIFFVIKALKDCFLLRETEDDEGAGYSSLAHDVLAPVVKDLYEQSDFDGQRSRRILAHRLTEWQREGDAFLLSSIDFEVVLAGKEGMRTWTPSEASFINASEKKIRRQKSIRQLQWGFGIFVILLLGILFSTYQIQKAEMHASSARKEAEIAKQDAFIAQAILDNLRLEAQADSLQMINTEEQTRNIVLSENLDMVSSARKITEMIALSREIAGNYVSRNLSGGIFLQKNGTIILNEGFGLAQKDKNQSFLKTTIFDIAELSKQFTAAGILLLAHQGAVDLHQSIATYLDDVPKDKKAVTIHNLLSHSSGLPDFVSNYDEFRNLDKKAVQTRIFNQTPLFKPGSTINPSISDYALLACIIEAISGSSYFEFCRNALFKPAEMHKTGFRGIDTWTSGEVAIGYGLKKKGNVPVSEWPKISWIATGQRGVLTNIQDLVKWKQFLLRSPVYQTMLDNGYIFQKHADNTVIFQESKGDYGQFSTFRSYPSINGSLIIISNTYDKQSKLVSALVGELERKILFAR